MTTAHIDFETRSRLDIKKVGVFEYAAHESTSIICMGWVLGDEQVEIWFPGEPFPNKLRQHILHGGKMFAWNAGFEREVWKQCALEDWPVVDWGRWRCTMAQAAVFGLPQGLEVCAKSLGIETRKYDVGKRAMQRLCKPNKKGEWVESAKDLINCGDYCKQDVFLERQIGEMLQPMPEREFKLWRLDQDMNCRGVHIDRDLCIKAQVMVDARLSDLNAELNDITGGVVTAASEITRLRDWITEQTGRELHTLDANMVKVLLADETIPPPVRRTLEIRQEGGKSSVAKLVAMLERSVSGPMRGNLRYYGAHTGRWSGVGAQVQNFPRGSFDDMDLLAETIKSGDVEMVRLFYGDEMEAVKSVLRGALIPAPHHRLLVWDFAQIEARLLAWYANETSILQQFANKDDIYKNFAAEVFAKKPHDINKTERFIGKTCVLGLGYQMGAVKFRSQLELFGTKVSEGFAKRCVDVYRGTFKNIVRSWKDTENQAYHASGMYRNEDRYLKCRLASGRDICYTNPRVKNNKLSFQTTFGGNVIREDTYGGKLVENIIQGLARDIMAEGMLSLEAQAIECLITVHDEVVATTKTEHAEQHLALGEKILTTVPTWAKGLPLAVEGFHTNRYRK